MARQNADRQIAEMLEKYGEEWNDATVWRVQGTAVIGHKPLERIAAKAGIVFRPPTILRAERDEAVILVTGAIGDNEEFREEWSIGEALIVREGTVGGNYKVSGKQASYPYAMAEKRAKDRVILKLVNLHGLAYSEEEADEFRQPQAENRNSQPHVNQDEGNNQNAVIADTMIDVLKLVESLNDLKAWTDKQRPEISALDEVNRKRVTATISSVFEKLGGVSEKAGAR